MLSYTQSTKRFFHGAILNLNKKIRKSFEHRTKLTSCPWQDSIQLCSQDNGVRFFLFPFIFLFWGMHLKERIAANRVGSHWSIQIANSKRKQSWKKSHVPRTGSHNRSRAGPVIDHRRRNSPREAKCKDEPHAARDSLGWHAITLIRDLSHRGQAAQLTHTHPPLKLKESFIGLSYHCGKLKIWKSKARKWCWDTCGLCRGQVPTSSESSEGTIRLNPLPGFGEASAGDDCKR